MPTYGRELRIRVPACVCADDNDKVTVFVYYRVTKHNAC